MHDRISTFSSTNTFLRIVAVCLVFGGWAGTASTAQAAGCRYSSNSPEVFYGHQQGVIAQDYWWTTGPLQRIYEDGKLLYFQIPLGRPPCHGPDCNASDPISTSTTTFIVSSHRINFASSASSPAYAPMEPQDRIAPLQDVLPASPILSGPFKPPRS